jgi:hypothetical protein
MAELQITRWRDLPSLVVARDGAEEVKVSLAPRLQEAIDEAAMRLGESDADAYLAGWVREPWTEVDGTPGDIAERVGRELEDQWDETAIAAYLDGLTA